MKYLFLLCLFVLLPGCAAKKFAIENADTLISHQITKRLPLYSKQKAQLNKDIDKFLNETKPLAQEILPVIDKINLEDENLIESQYQKLENYFATISDRFSALMAVHIAKLDKKQQKSFFNVLDDENRELLKQEKEKRLDKIEERFKVFLGSITGEQKQLIREYGDYFQERSEERLSRRVKLHTQFREIFKTDLSEDGRAGMIHEAFLTYQKETAKGHKNVEMLKKLLPTLTKKQREHFRNQSKEIKELLKYYISIDY